MRYLSIFLRKKKRESLYCKSINILIYRTHLNYHLLYRCMYTLYSIVHKTIHNWVSWSDGLFSMCFGLLFYWHLKCPQSGQLLPRPCASFQREGRGIYLRIPSCLQECGGQLTYSSPGQCQLRVYLFAFCIRKPYSFPQSFSFGVLF